MHLSLKTFTRSIRTKLIVFIALPILIFSTAGIFFTILKISNNAEQQLKERVIIQAQQYATILNAEFDAITKQLNIIAKVMINRTGDNIQHLISASEDVVNSSKLVHGIGFVFNDLIADKNEYQSLYLHKGHTSSENIIILENSLNQVEDRFWYTQAKEAGRLVWSEPYNDVPDNDLIKVTAVLPVYIQNNFAGISFIDIDLSEIQSHSALQEITDQAFVIISRLGQFITHPNPEFILQKNLKNYALEINDEELLAISLDMLNGKSGQRRVSSVSIDLNEPYWLYYAPIKSIGWSFATGLPEKEIFEYTRRQIIYGLIGITMIILFTVICVMVVASNLTKPLFKLNQAIEKLGQGDLTVNLKDISTGDEIGQLSKAFNRMTLQLRQYINELEKQYAQRDAVENELRLARSIQASLIPSNFPAFPGYDEFDLFAINHPAKHVAGDFFDFFLLDTCRLFVVIADVSGKGIGPALLMAVSRTHIRDLAAEGHSPAMILTELNKLLIEDREHPMFVTVFVAEYDIKNGNLCYANGGHVLPYLINKDGVADQFGKTTGTIVGMLDDAIYDEESITLQKSETLVLYTDGFLEARLIDGEFFGEQHFRTLLSANADMNLEDLCDTALASVKTYQGNKLNDDVTMLTLRRLK